MNDTQNNEQRKITIPDGLFSNAATIATEAIIAPFTTSIIVTTVRARTRDHATPSIPPKGPTRRLRLRTPKTIPENPLFKLVFLTVVVITLLAGIAEITMAAIWTHPTPDQQSAFEAAGFGWKAGLGAIFGLLGGKIT